MNNADKLFLEPLAGMLDRKREAVRARGKSLIYDCSENAVYGDRVRCVHGCYLGLAKDGTVSLLKVLEGIAPSKCQKCDYYSEGYYMGN